MQLIKSDTNVGFAKGNNLGIAKAQGDYVLLLNSDTKLTENSIRICLDKLLTQEKIAVTAPQLIYPNGQYQPIANRFPSIRYELTETFRLHKLLGAKSLMGFYFNHQQETYTDWVWGAFFLIKREVIRQLPNQKLPDDFFMYFEDVQWCYQIKKLGYQILFTPSTSVIHYGSASTPNTENTFQRIKKILPNETSFFLQEKGWLYTKLLYLSRAFKYLTLRKKHFVDLSKFYFKYFWYLKINE
ncbi:MAG: glycosyltransferase [Thermonemataceae bacterium]